MIVILIMVAAVVIPLIMFFFIPNQPRQINNNNQDINSSTSRGNANDSTRAPVHEGRDEKGADRRSEVPSSEIVALQSRLHITRVDSSITLSIHTSGLLPVGANEISSNDYDGLDKVLSQLTEIGDVYILVHCENGEDEQHEMVIRQYLGGKVAYFQRFPHRILFCSSHVGKVAFVRQLKPVLHVEYHPEVYESLRPHIPTIVLHRLSESGVQSAYSQHQRPFPNIIRHQISHLLALTVKS